MCIVIAVLALSFLCGVCVSYVSYILPPDTAKMEWYFTRDESELKTVVEHIRAEGYDSFYVDDNYLKNDYMQTNGYTSRIGDEKLKKAITTLIRSRGYRCISVNAKTVVFEKWCYGEREIGMAAPINGNDSPRPSLYTVKTEPLSAEGWYYYVSDYGEYTADA